METYFIKEIDDLNLNLNQSSLILGNFDGVHIGHTQLITFAKSMCENEKLVVITFDKSLKNSNHSTYLTDIKTKEEIFKHLGVDVLLVFITDQNLKAMTYDSFIKNILKKIDPLKIFCGPDFRYGNKAEGTIEELKKNFKNVYVLNNVITFDEMKISSSIIKKHIASGNIHLANQMLGRPYLIKGIVVKGKGNGKKIGFPTINLKLEFNYTIPNNGVYVSKTIIDGNTYFSISSIGTHPTIDEIKESIVETHLLDFDEDVYGKEVSVIFFKKIREEIKFNSIDQLVEQIKGDIKKANQYFMYEN